jgi:hypothetical protein
MEVIEMDIKEFKKLLASNKCPFCKNELKYYDGALGYEAYKCYSCKITLDHNGIHLED